MGRRQGEDMDSQLTDQGIETKQWFVMTHLEPLELEHWIIESNALCVKRGDDPIDYFIPYLVLERQTVGVALSEENYAKVYPQRPVSEAERHHNEIRNVLRRFVFLKTTAKGMQSLLHEHWNYGRLKLIPYKDVDGSNAVIDDMMMQHFINACLDQRERFEVHPHVAEIAKGAEVIIRRGAFKDLTAQVFDIQHTAAGIRLTLSLDFFGHTQDIRLYDKTLEDVHFCNDEPSAISHDFIDRTMSVLIEVLDKRINQKSGRDKDDLVKLNMLYLYRHMHIADTCLKIQNDALMLICASLRYDAEGRSYYNSIVKKHIKNINLQTHQSSADINALLTLYIALFISTKDQEYRQKAKAIFRDLPSVPSNVQRFIAHIRKM